MAKRRYQLNEKQIMELIAAYSGTNNGAFRTRLQAVRLYGSGYPVKEISAICQCSRTSLMEWCRKYAAEGLQALTDHRVGGNRRKLTRAQIADLSERLRQYTPRALFGPEAASPEGKFWTVTDLQRAVLRWYGVTYQSHTTCLTLLANCGFSYQRPARVFKSRRETDVAAFEALVEKN